MGFQSRREVGHDFDHVAGVAGGGVFLPLAGEDRHGQLGEVLEREDIDFGAFDEATRGVGVVTEEAGGVGDFDAVLRHGEVWSVGVFGIAFIAK